MTDSYGQRISNLFTGSAGNSQTVILPFDEKPFITESPFYWKNGKDWNRSARNAKGEPLYPAGTYIFTISQNLNHMQETYRSSGITDLEGKITQTKTITFIKETTPPATSYYYSASADNTTTSFDQCFNNCVFSHCSDIIADRKEDNLYPSAGMDYPARYYFGGIIHSAKESIKDIHFF